MANGQGCASSNAVLATGKAAGGDERCAVRAQVVAQWHRCFSHPDPFSAHGGHGTTRRAVGTRCFSNQKEISNKNHDNPQPPLAIPSNAVQTVAQRDWRMS